MGGQIQVLQQEGGFSHRVDLLDAPCHVPAVTAVQHPDVQSGGAEGEGVRVGGPHSGLLEAGLSGRVHAAGD